MTIAFRAALGGVLVGLLTAAAPAAAVNLIVNGDFEDASFGGTTGYYNVGDPGSGADHPIPPGFGWSVPFNNVDIIANGVYAANLPTGGAYNLDLVGYGSTGAIAQTFATEAGKVYRISLDYTQNGSGKTADVVVGTSILTTLEASSAWQSWTTTFVGTGDPTTLVIAEILGGSNAGVILDNISVTAVPEPATWAMLITGFGMVGYGLRRRRASVTA
jgi:hypothetical protein